MAKFIVSLKFEIELPDDEKMLADAFESDTIQEAAETQLEWYKDGTADLIGDLVASRGVTHLEVITSETPMNEPIFFVDE